MPDTVKTVEAGPGLRLSELKCLIPISSNGLIYLNTRYERV